MRTREVVGRAPRAEVEVRRLVTAVLSCVLTVSFSLFPPSRMNAGDERAIAIDGPPPPQPPEVISRDERGRVTLRAVALDAPLVLDGTLDEPVYRTVPPIRGFLQQEPHEGEPATEETEVWVLFDRRNVYVSARCWDSHPERIVANEMRRDSRSLFQNANFAVILDTFYDRRNGFFFHTNPLGGLFDAQITDERDVNRDWNTVWYVETGRFANGWTVEMAIPFKSLRYPSAGPQTWGINFRRVVRWKNELSYLTAIPASYGPRGITKLSSAATLVGLETPARSKNLEIKPYATSGIATDRVSDPPISNRADADAGFDFKYGLSRGLISDFTYNTDFAQVEVDEEQVNLTRFSLFFPEKREFFLEGQGIFQFGAGGGGGRGGGQSNTPILFFSRRIGLEDGRVVPILAGGRLAGRAGKYSIGALDIQTGTEAALDARPTNFSVLRLKRDVLRRSAVGLIGTLRSPSTDGDGVNRVAGVDANMAFYDNLRINGYYARSHTGGVGTANASYQARFDYGSDRYGLQLERLVVEEGFRPEIGFLRREDFQMNLLQARFSPRPGSIAAIRKLGWEAGLEYTTDNRGRLETRDQRLGFNVELENGDGFFVAYSRSFEFLPDPFEISRGVVLPVGGYGFEEVWSGYELGPQRRLSGNVRIGKGRFYDGDRTAFRYDGRVEVTPQVALEPRVSWDWVSLPQGRFTTRLVSARVSYTLSPRTSFSALVQYNSSADAASANLRFRWEYEPGSDLFVVYNEGRDTTYPGFPSLINRSLVVKFTKLFRF